MIRQKSSFSHSRFFSPQLVPKLRRGRLATSVPLTQTWSAKMCKTIDCHCCRAHRPKFTGISCTCTDDDERHTVYWERKHHQNWSVREWKGEETPVSLGENYIVRLTMNFMKCNVLMWHTIVWSEKKTMNKSHVRSTSECEHGDRNEA